MSLYITHIQIAEVLGNNAVLSDAIIRKCGIIQTILAIDVKIVPISIVYISEPVNIESQRIPGYKGPQVGTFRVASESLVNLMKNTIKLKRQILV